MGRILSVLLAALLTLIMAGALLWYLSYGLTTAPPGQITLDSLDSSVQINWHDEGFASISQGTELDRYAALGFVHGSSRPWSVTLWRQTAVGKLGTWFGRSMLEVDSLTRQLGLARLARQTYDQLPTSEQRRLRAYAQGMNAALQRTASHSAPHLTLMDLQPSEWQPWHALAVERLFAWLATSPPPADSLAQAGPMVTSFFEADRQLREWLHLHGFDHSAAWIASDSTGTHLYRRYVYGATALPFLQEIALQRSDNTYLLGGSLPGTPFFPTGQTPDHAWAVLPSSSLEVSQAALPDTFSQPVYERLRDRSGQEYLLRIWQANGALPFIDDTSRSSPLSGAAVLPDTARSDTVATGRQAWTIRWDGLRPLSDAAAWQALAQDETGSFQLMEGNGLYLRADGSWRVSGTPNVQHPLSGGVLIGQAHWANHLGTYLDSLSQGQNPDATAWSDDCYSAWAADNTPELLTSIEAVNRTIDSDNMQQALTYLRNWNYSYDKSSIAASIFDAWAARHQEQTGRLPGEDEPAPEPSPLSSTAPDTTSDTTRTAARPDTLTQAYRQHRQRFRLLEETVRHLTEEFGNDLRQWRWERVNQSRYYFPVWSDDRTAPASSLADTRYAPFELPGRGHPSSPCWGTSAMLDDRPSPAMWQGWTSTDSWQQLDVQYRRFEFGRFMDRYRIPDRFPAPRSLRAFPTTNRTTTLVPPS